MGKSKSQKWYDDELDLEYERNEKLKDRRQKQKQKFNEKTHVDDRYVFDPEE